MLERLSEGATAMSVAIDYTNDCAATSWVSGTAAHPDFPVQNLPFGIFRLTACHRAAVSRLGTISSTCLRCRNSSALKQQKLPSLHLAGTLNDLFARGQVEVGELRRQAFTLLTDPKHSDKATAALYRAADCGMHVPFAIGDYTDFYTGIHHAENIGKQLRPDNPLLPNYKHVPIGYHGRASSIRPTGVDVRRPQGQTKAPDAEGPSFGPCRRMDYELEMAIWIGEGNPLGQPIPIGAAASHIAGLSLLNDWSARDLQAWEYQPLGPFLAKNFQSTISPWVVTPQALAPYRVAQATRPTGDPQPLSYLVDAVDQASGAFDVTMEVHIHTARMRAEGMAPHRLSRGSMTSMYWTVAQLIAHHSSNGCNLQPGDLLGTGTLSGADETSMGSLMEISRGGKQPSLLPSGEERSFLEDGDELIMSAYCARDGFARIGFGECRAQVLPS